MSNLVEQAITLIKEGKLDEAKPLLVQSLKQNPRDEMAWLALSRCLPTNAEKRECFQRVLRINPSNQIALKAMEKLSGAPSQIPAPTVRVTDSSPSASKPVSSVPTLALQRVPAPPSQQPTPVQMASSNSSKDANARQQPGNGNSAANKKRAQPKRKGISSAIWLPIILALISCCSAIVHRKISL